MQVRCRATCKQWIEKHNGAEIPTELIDSGSYADIINDTLGHQINICKLNEGYTITARETLLAILSDNIGQPKLLPTFHSIGFQKERIPRDICGQILTNRKTLLNNKVKWAVEYCMPGVQNCNRILESEKAQECHEISRENYFFLPLSKNTLNSIFKKLLPLAENWIQNKIKLEGTRIYGIRKYTRGAKLAAHNDQIQTHVISAILNIRQVILFIFITG